MRLTLSTKILISVFILAFSNLIATKLVLKGIFQDTNKCDDTHKRITASFSHIFVICKTTKKHRVSIDIKKADNCKVKDICDLNSYILNDTLYLTLADEATYHFDYYISMQRIASVTVQNLELHLSDIPTTSFELNAFANSEVEVNISHNDSLSLMNLNAKGGSQIHIIDNNNSTNEAIKHSNLSIKAANIRLYENSKLSVSRNIENLKIDTDSSSQITMPSYMLARK